MNYELRPATKSDYTYCYKLTKHNMLNSFCRHWGGWVASEFRKGYSVENITMIVVNGRRAGYLSIKPRDGSIYLNNIQLSPTLQSRGIGTRILQDFLSANQDSVIQLTTFEDNPAKRLYERLGFVVINKDGMTLKMQRAIQD